MTAAGLALAALALPAHAAPSNASAPSPFAARDFHAPSFVLHPDRGAPLRVRLEEIGPEALARTRRANGEARTKRLQVGVARKLPAPQLTRSAAAHWRPVAGGVAAHWEVTSPGAAALRLGLVLERLAAGAELRFAGRADLGTVYGPFTAAELLDGEPVQWSPVLPGESALLEVFVPGADPRTRVDLAIAAVSHLFAAPTESEGEIVAKVGESGSCQRDMICLAASDAALANSGKAVARMVFSDAGGSYLCTGTLLNPAGGSFTPYFYTAHHCVGSQALASTLTTHWFYDRTGCGTGVTSGSYRQLAGGAAYLFGSYHDDATLLRLNGTPPSGAWYSGWSASTVASGTALKGIHHPRGDWKKVSLGAARGFESNLIGRAGSFVIVDWNSTATGVTEPGSSGSGIFTAAGAGASDYQFRGGLLGGTSACDGSGMRDYYSRFDVVYPSISQYLSPPIASYALTASKNGSGSGTVSSSPGGISCGATCSATYASGSVVSLSAAPSAGSAFAGWSGACTGSGACSVTMTAAKSVVATFSLLDDYADSWSSAKTLNRDSTTAGHINSTADVDWFRFDFPGRGTWSIRTTGTTDTAGEAYADDGRTLLAANDDAGGPNFGLTLFVPDAARLFLRVSGHGGVTTGPYTLASSFRPSLYAAATDLDRSGKSDILWRNEATGQVYRMLMSGLSAVAGGFAYTEPDTRWEVVADADFDGDGTADLLWRHLATGQVAIQFYGANGLPTGGAAFATEADPAWRIVQTPDLDGDGKADIVWWNSTTGQVYAMLMDGAAIRVGSGFYRESDTAWRIVASGDFAGSGKRNQLLWRNATTGQVFLMTVDVSGATLAASGRVIYHEPNIAWKIVAAADFDGDGRSDILWRNDATGQVYMMLMNGSSAVAQGFVYREPNLAWQIAAQGDYDGDGRADLLWRNGATGQLYMMLMGGLSIASQRMIYQEPNLDWKVLGPLEYASW